MARAPAAQARVCALTSGAGCPSASGRTIAAAAADYASAPENTFEFGLQTILDGLETRLSTRSTPTGRDPHEARRHYQELCAQKAARECL